MFNGNTSAPGIGRSRGVRAGRTDIGYRLALGALLVGLAAATPWLQLSFQGNDPLSQLVELGRAVGGTYLVVGAAALAVLIAVIGGLVLLVSVLLGRSGTARRDTTNPGARSAG